MIDLFLHNPGAFSLTFLIAFAIGYVYRHISPSLAERRAVLGNGR